MSHLGWTAFLFTTRVLASIDSRSDLRLAIFPTQANGVGQ